MKNPHILVQKLCKNMVLFYDTMYTSYSIGDQLIINISPNLKVEINYEMCHPSDRAFFRPWSMNITINSGKEELVFGRSVNGEFKDLVQDMASHISCSLMDAVIKPSYDKQFDIIANHITEFNKLFYLLSTISDGDYL